MRIRHIRALGAAVAMAATMATAAGCGSSTLAPAGGGDNKGTVTVLAAASLTETFTKLGKDFEAAHPGTKVTFSFAGSSALAQQIKSGAPADVFASASPTNMKQATDEPSTVFVRNELVIAVPKGNPKKITGLADLTKVKVALCAAQVPCGAAATTALKAAGVTITPVTLEQDVKATLTKLKLGEVDVALVYRTDARSAADTVEGVSFPEAAKAINDYPIAALSKGPNPAGGKAFVEFVRSEKARTTFTDAGFTLS